MIRLLSQKQAAELLGLSVRTLERYRRAGIGPTFCRIGSRMVRYREQDLQAWTESSLRSSTSENARLGVRQPSGWPRV